MSERSVNALSSVLLLSILLGCPSCGGRSEAHPKPDRERGGWLKVGSREYRVTGAVLHTGFGDNELQVAVSGVAGEGDDLRGYEHSWSAAAYLEFDVKPGEYRLDIRPFDQSIGSAAVSSSDLPGGFLDAGTLWITIRGGEISGRAEDAEGGEEGAFSAPLKILCIAPHEQISEGYDPELSSPFCRPLRRFL